MSYWNSLLQAIWSAQPGDSAREEQMKQGSTRGWILGCASIFLLGGLLLLALVQKKGAFDLSQSVHWAAGMIDHVQKMRNLFTHHDVDRSSQLAPPDIPKQKIDPDPSGRVETFQPGGATSTAENPFFQNLGTNGRTCFTCHQPQTGWTISGPAPVPGSTLAAELIRSFG